jgi:hypothetical protein
MSKPHLELINWLKSRDAHYIDFGDGTVLSHLEGVFKILSSNEQPQAVCLAGLFSAIYDIRVFEDKNLGFDEREVLSNLIGKDAEHLVWLFSKLDRPKAFEMFCETPTAAALPLIDGTEMSLQAFDLCSLMPQLLTLQCANFLERQVLWRNQWLVPHAKQCGLLTDEGEQPDHVTVEAHMAQMLVNAKQALVLELVKGINFQRKGLASAYWWGDNVRAIKIKQAQAIIQAKGSVDSGIDINLVSNYANVNGLSLLAAAEGIIVRADAFQTKLIETEVLKDTLMADIQRARNFEDIERVRAVLDEKA